MVYDESLAARVRKCVARRKNMVERKMFGGVGFLMNGNMCVGVWKEYLIVRARLDRYEELLDQAFVKKFDITGRVMKGWIMVDLGGLETDDDLRDWIQIAVKFVSSLPPKVASGHNQ